MTGIELASRGTFMQHICASRFNVFPRHGIRHVELEGKPRLNHGKVVERSNLARGSP